MKKGLFVLAALTVLIGGTAFAQASANSVDSIMVDTFDTIGEQNYAVREYKNGAFTETIMNWTWGVSASRYVAEGYPILPPEGFPAIPNPLKVLRRDDDPEAKVLGVKTKFNRKGNNWFEVYPMIEDKPAEIPLKGKVDQIDFWAWGAGYLYYLEVLVRDSDGAVRILPAGNLTFNGWKNIVIKIPSYVRQESRRRSGPKDITFVGFRIISDPSELVDDFVIYFDNLKYATNEYKNIYDGYELRYNNFGDGEEDAGAGE